MKMETHLKYHAFIPREDISFAFIDHLEKKLKEAKFEKSFQHQDPGGVDVYRYQKNKVQTIVITRSRSDVANDELNISSEWDGLPALIDGAADSFGRDIAQIIKRGRVSK